MTHDDRQHVDLQLAPAVLLIDDNAIQAATRQTILRRAGYFVIAALNPQRALEQFQNNEFPAEIGLVITDHIMPGMNGAEFVRELRKTHPDLPVLVISGLEEAERSTTASTSSSASSLSCRTCSSLRLRQFIALARGAAS